MIKDLYRRTTKKLITIAFLSLATNGCTEVPLVGDSPELVDLGSYLFFDPNLSEPRGVSCASCHQEAQGLSGNNSSPIRAVAQGSLPGRFGTRNAPSISYSSFVPPLNIESMRDAQGFERVLVSGGQFWDGRAADLVEQAKAPLLDPREMNNPSPGVVVAKVRNSPYAGLLIKIFGPEVFNDEARAFHAIAEALAAFERSYRIPRFQSKFDAVLVGLDRFTEQEGWGFELFKDPNKGNCLSCHSGADYSSNPAEWMFTNYRYMNIGVPRNYEIPANRDPNYFDLGLCNSNALKAAGINRPQGDNLCGSFRVPSLRNVAVSAPYMHNGKFNDLKEVVEFYVTRDIYPERWYKSRQGADTILPFGYFNDVPTEFQRNVVSNFPPFDRRRGEQARLSPQEIDAIVQFLYTLTDRVERP